MANVDTTMGRVRPLFSLKRLRGLRFNVPRPSAEMFRRVEDFAVDHMPSLAIGAGVAIVTIAGILVFDNPAPQVPGGVFRGQVSGVDRTIVGSIGQTSQPPRRAQWSDVPRPVEIMALEAPLFDRQQARYRARRAANGDREDALLFDSTAATQPEARVALIRRATEAGESSLFVDMMRLQAERGVSVTKAGVPGPLVTKFGQLEVADMTFTDADGQNLACIAFRTPQSASRIAMNGWFCAATGAVVERPMVSCFVDRLALLKGGEDMALRRFFTEAEQRRQPCPMRKLANGKRVNWLDAEGTPPAIRGATSSAVTRR